jgi:hypothetical protein
MNLQEDIHRIKEVMGVISEQEASDYDFYKTTYDPDDKSIVGAYMITGEDDNTIQVMNIKEMVRENRIYMDNAKEYSLGIQKFNLPKSQVKVLDSVDGMEGFNYIKVPYWLYKKMIDQLEVIRIKDKKRPDVPLYQTKNKSFIKKLSDPDVIKYISITNPDKSGIANLVYTIQRYNVEE